MKNKKLISAVLSLSMLASAFGVTAVHAEETAAAQSTWTDSFDTDAARITGTTGSLNDNWKITENGFSTAYAEITGGMLRVIGVGTTTTAVAPRSYAAVNSSAENTVSFDLAHYTTDTNWDLFTAAVFRFGMSADGNSYYEIGKQGSGTAVSNYKIPCADTDGTPFNVTVNGTEYTYAVDVVKTKTADGTKETITPTKDNKVFTNTDSETYSVTTEYYAYRKFFRKVENGVTVYVQWENAVNGIFQKTKPYGDAIF